MILNSTQGKLDSKTLHKQRLFEGLISLKLKVPDHKPKITLRPVGVQCSCQGFQLMNEPNEALCLKTWGYHIMNLLGRGMTK